MADSIVDTYASLDPLTGQVRFNFTGHIKAKGLDLDASTNAFVSDNMVRWLRPTDGLTTADLISFYAAGAAGTLLAAASDPSDNRYLAQVSCEANNNISGLSSVRLDCADPVNGHAQKLLVRSDGLSDFLQLNTQAGRRIAFGSANLNFNASALSDVLTIAHGLGVVPALVLALGRGQSSNTYWVNEWAAPDINNISLRAQAPVALNGLFGCYWAAIG